LAGTRKVVIDVSVGWLRVTAVKAAPFLLTCNSYELIPDGSLADQVTSNGTDADVVCNWTLAATTVTGARTVGGVVSWGG